MIVAIDTTSFRGKYDNGKEQVLINLLQGFQDLGVGEQLKIICHESRYDIYRKFSPNSQFFIIKNAFVLKGGKLSFFQRVIRKIKYLVNEFNFYKFKKALNHKDVDVIFFTNKESPNIRFNKPTVEIPHDIQPVSHPERFKKLRAMTENTINDFKLRDILISISDFDKNEMLQHFPQYAHKIVKIYNPIICKNDINKGTRKGIVCVNVNYSHKNFITTLKAYNKIKDIINERLIVTSFFNNAECLNYIKKHKLQSYIEFTGYLEENELRKIIGNARLYVSSSEYEGFGMTPVEAIIQGVPCVVYKGTASYESTQGLATYYDNCRDENELADKILEELKKPLDFEELEKKSRILSEMYDYKKIAREYWSLFEQLVNHKKHK